MAFVCTVSVFRKLLTTLLVEQLPAWVYTRTHSNCSAINHEMRFITAYLVAKREHHHQFITWYMDIKLMRNFTTDSTDWCPYVHQIQIHFSSILIWYKKRSSVIHIQIKFCIYGFCVWSSVININISACESDLIVLKSCT